MSHRFDPQHFPPRRLLLALALLLGVWSPATLHAQAPAAAPVEYAQDELDPNGKDWRKLTNFVSNDEERNAIVQMLNGDTDIENGRFDNFFKRIVFPHFTRISYAVVPPDGKKNLAARTDLMRMRAEFKKTFFSKNAIANAAIAKQARDKLNGLLNERLFQIAAGLDQANQPKKYHPLVRFHAAMFLGELIDDTAQNMPPFRPALTNLSRLAVPRATPDVPDSIRVIALKGILNHLRVNRIDDANYLNALNSTVVEYWLSLKELPSGGSMTQDGLDWIQRRVIEIALEANSLKSVDPAKPPIPKLPELLAAIVANERSGVAVRLFALNALAGMNELPATIKLDDLAKSAGSVGVAAVRRQLQDIQALPYPPDAAKPLKHDLTLLDQSLTALAKRSEKIAALRAKVEAVITACDTLWEEKRDPDGLYKAIQKTGAELDMLVTGKTVSDLNPEFVQVPKGFSGGSGAGFGGFGGGR